MKLRSNRLSFRAVLFSTIETNSGPATKPLDRFNYDCESCKKIMNPNDEYNWREHSSMRSECLRGKEFEFSSEQIEYHYTKNKHKLMKAWESEQLG